MITKDKVKKLIENLVGESVQITCSEFDSLKFFKEGVNLGFSQFNELLLFLGFDRITQSFFQFLVNQKTNYDYRSKISSVRQLEKGVNEFRKLSILLFANVKYGYKILARDADELKYHLETLTPNKLDHFTNRHNPIMPIERIPANETYLMGYKIKERLNEMFEKEPSNNDLLRLLEKQKKIFEIGKRNQKAYLASDHLDVYVATSMRLEHEYVSVNKTISKIFSHEKLKKLKLRWFDPTQAYCENRIDKGLAEGLMLKRAKCTIYLAQESDTLGKDSELASTLAQGKPVIALVPEGDKKYVDELISTLSQLNPKIDKKILILDQLKVFDSSLAWSRKEKDQIIRKWIDNPDIIELPKLMKILYETVQKHYDDRAKTLKYSHPLGIQVDLETGVATGVLVVRNIDVCAKLVRAALFKSINFNIVSEPSTQKETGEYTYLVETISDSIYRVVTGDPMLTNAFWNFYIDEPIEPENNK